MWSTGIVLYEAMIGEVPFEEQALCKLFLHATNRNYVGFAPPAVRVPDGPKKYRDIITGLIQIDPEERLKCEELYQAAVLNKPLPEQEDSAKKKKKKKLKKGMRKNISAAEVSQIPEEFHEESENNEQSPVGIEHSKDESESKFVDPRSLTAMVLDKVLYYGCCCCCLNKH